VQEIEQLDLLTGNDMIQLEQYSKNCKFESFLSAPKCRYLQS